MKRLFILSFLFIFAINLFAQKISVDRIESDGRHQIMTSSKSYSVEGTNYSFCMKVYESSEYKDWLLLISSYSYISKASELLIKLGNDEVLYLPVNNVNVGKVTQPGYGYTIGNITSMIPSVDVDYYSSVYELTSENINKIDSLGIKKIRFSNGTSYKDKTFEYNSLGKFLGKCYKNILKRLENPLKKKGLFDDF